MNRWNFRGAVLLPWLAIAFGYLYHPHPKLMMKGSCPDLKDAKSLSLKKTAQISKPRYVSIFYLYFDEIGL